jgi:hypothetical protein
MPRSAMRGGVAAGATTGIGSLPHQDADAAVAFALDCGCDLPFWPQLPRRDMREWMVPQYAADLPGLRLDAEAKRFWIEEGPGFVESLTALYERLLDPAASFALSRDHARGWYAFLDALEAGRDKPRFLKGQITGPLTFSLGLNRADGKPIYADAQLRDAAVRVLAAQAAWQVGTLCDHAGEEVVVFVDEPILSALGTPAYLNVGPGDAVEPINEVVRAIHEAGGMAGIHCCGNADWGTVLSSEVDIVNFDAWNYFDTLLIYAEAVGAFLERGGRLAFGIVPTDDQIADVGEGQIADRLDEQVSALVARGLREDRVRRQALLTPSCGCGSRSEAETEKVFGLLRQAGAHWRSRV